MPSVAYPNAKSTKSRTVIYLVKRVKEDLVMEENKSITEENTSNEYSLVKLSRIDGGEMIEIRILKFRNNTLIERYSTIIKPTRPVEEVINETTEITKQELENADTIDKVMPKVLDIIGDSTILSRNGKTTRDILDYQCKKLGLKISNPYKDIKDLSKEEYNQMKTSILDLLSESIGLVSKA